MSNEPIVAPLVDRLSWSAWLKPFFIHPSVTAGAKVHMQDVRWAREQIAEAKKAKADRAKFMAVLAAIDKVFALAVPVDLSKVENEQNREVLRKIKRSLEQLNLAPVAKKDVEANQPGTVTLVSSADVGESEDRELSLEQLQAGIESAFLDVLKLKDATLRKNLLTAFVKLSPQYKAVSDIIDILEKEAEKLVTAKESDFISDRLYRALAGEDRSYHPVKSAFEFKLDTIFNDSGRLFNDGHPALASLNKAREVINPATRNVKPNVEVNPREVLPYVSLESKWSIVKGSFWRAIGFHGYETTTTALTDTRGKRFHFVGSNYFWFTLAAFMGLPTRLESKSTTAVYGWRTFARDLFGGWESLLHPEAKGALSHTRLWMLNPYNYNLEGKRLWNLILLVTGVKFVIAAYYLVTFPVKLALNLVRQVTETLPQSLVNYFGERYGNTLSFLAKLHYQNDKLIAKAARGFVPALVLIVSFAVHHVARLALLVGEAATSPYESAKQAWAYGRALDSRFGLVFAILGGAASIALTSVIWALVFPAIFAKALIVFPALAPYVTAASQLQIVAYTIQTVNGAATLVAGTVPALLGGAAAAISYAFGTAVSINTLATALTAALFAAPIATVVAKLSFDASNAWTRWKADWTLTEAASRAVADVAISTHTAFLQLLPSKQVTEYSEATEEAYYGSIESEKLANARANEFKSGRFNPYSENLDTLKFPKPAREYTRLDEESGSGLGVR